MAYKLYAYQSPTMGQDTRILLIGRIEHLQNSMHRSLTCQDSVISSAVAGRPAEVDDSRLEGNGTGQQMPDSWHELDFPRISCLVIIQSSACYPVPSLRAPSPKLC